MASRASDNERKIVTDRKRGKEGTKANVYADANDGKLYAMSICCPGEAEMTNLEELVQRMPDVSNNRYHATNYFDRGYGKQPQIEAQAKRV